ncbi:ABC exporter membrane fusion protein [Mastigocoleus testarum]|uniref:Uncharacterized protein n=1 Tax=Mastigocoleus testarum BC008 TaxID=371196 RepID=A0A0V8A0R7_9CYAN|nr:ABC exporter membrane fusion protein [Mastigocoleus testarum]KST70368.1 hypothetical protein BC008_45040 [Mastigocoleus testarum BC008]
MIFNRKSLQKYIPQHLIKVIAFKKESAVNIVAPLALILFSLPLYIIFTNIIFTDSQKAVKNVEKVENNKTISQTPSISKSNIIKTKVSALGRIQPKNKIITISGSSNFQYARVGKIFIKEGDKVRVGQAVAVLDNLNQLQTTLEGARKDLMVSQAELSQVKAGESKKAEISAQKAAISDLKAEFQGETAIQEAKIARLRANLKINRAERLRFQQLYQSGAISVSELDSKILAEKTVQEELNEAQETRKKLLSTYPKRITQAQANLNKLNEVRPVDVKVAQAKVEKAMTQVKIAKADLDLAYVRAPVDGKILKIHTFAGENITDKGIIDIGETGNMYVIAEVYQTDISKLKIGQKAIISGDALNHKFQGVVEHISSAIGKKEVFNDDPILDIDSRVFEVKIKIDPKYNQEAAQLINLQVDVKIY